MRTTQRRLLFIQVNFFFAQGKDRTSASLFALKFALFYLPFNPNALFWLKKKKSLDICSLQLLPSTQTSQLFAFRAVRLTDNTHCGIFPLVAHIRLYAARQTVPAPPPPPLPSTPPPSPVWWWSLPVVRIRVGRAIRKRGARLERTRLPTSPSDASTYRTGFLGFGSVSHLNKQSRRWRRVNGVKKKLSIRERVTSTR